MLSFDTVHAITDHLYLADAAHPTDGLTTAPALLLLLELLGDAEIHDECGIHDADGGTGEPGGRIGEVSPIIGKAPGTPSRLHRHNRGLARST